MAGKKKTPTHNFNRMDTPTYTQKRFVEESHDKLAYVHKELGSVKEINGAQYRLYQVKSGAGFESVVEVWEKI